jgi:hypothetical protein
VRTKDQKRLEDYKLQLKEVRSENRELRKTTDDLKVSRESWKDKLQNKQYELKIQKNTTLAMRKSRERWQSMSKQIEKEIVKIILVNGETKKEMQTQLDLKKEENEFLHRELKKKKY